MGGENKRGQERRERGDATEKRREEKRREGTGEEETTEPAGEGGGDVQRRCRSARLTKLAAAAARARVAHRLE